MLGSHSTAVSTHELHDDLCCEAPIETIIMDHKDAFEVDCGKVDVALQST